MADKDIDFESEVLAASLERDRDMFSDAFAKLRARVTPDGMMGEGLGLLRESAMSSAKYAKNAALANPVATAMIGAGLVWLSISRRAPSAAKLAADDGQPAWLREAAVLHDQAMKLEDDFTAVARAAELAQAEIDDARSDIREALQRDLKARLDRGLEHLSPDEREAARLVREKRMSRELGLDAETSAGIFGMKTLMGGAALAAGAAALTAFVNHRSHSKAAATEAQSEAMIRDLQSGLEKIRKQIDAAASKLSGS